MKDYNRKIVLICPLCGNDGFSSIDKEVENLLDAAGSTKFQCADCKSIYTKDELIESNVEKIEIVKDEMVHDAMKDIEKALRKAFK